MRFGCFKGVTIAVCWSLFIGHAIASTTVGNTDGGFSVGSSGAATYTIPIRVAPGIGDLQPDLSLVYNSQAGNGPLGIGWSIGGQSVITRCSQTYAQDGKSRGISFDSEDRLCMDGQRLILANNSSYGKSGAEYRTERESYVKVTTLSSRTDGTVSSFSSKTKDGLTMIYGGTENSRIKAEGKDVITTWALSEIQDNVGNRIKFSYINSHSGEYYLDTVTYGEIGNGAVSRSVHFIYDYDSNIRKDHFNGYKLGSKLLMTKRLTTIESMSNANLVARYTLSYAYESTRSDGRSILKSITECGADGITCLKPVTFDWNIDEPNFGDQVTTSINKVVQYPDLNGDSIPDICYRASNGINCRLGDGFGNWGDEVTSSLCSNAGDQYGCDGDDDIDISIQYADFNGDGRQELLYRAKTGIQVFKWKDGNDGFESFSSTTLCANNLVQFAYSETNETWESYAGDCYYSTKTTAYTLEQALKYIKYKISTADINGDGLTDLCYLSRHDGVVCHLNTGQEGASLFGSPIKTNICSETDTSCSSVGSIFVILKKSVSYVDFNADGMADLGVHEKNGVSIYLSTGSGFTLQSSAPICAYNSGSKGCNDEDNYNTVRYADINGDGLTDVCYRSDEGVMCHTNTGQGGSQNWGARIETGICNNTDCTNSQGHRGSLMFTDFNADGKSDLIVRDSGGLKTFLSIGSGFIEKSNTRNDICADGSKNYGACDNADNYSTINFVDINADGRADLTYRSDQGIVSFIQDYKFTQIKKTTNSLGLSAAIEYASLTKHSVYKPINPYSYGQLITGCIYPIRCGAFPSQVVASTIEDTGVRSTISKQYHYYDARTDLRGRGTLGFGYMDSYDVEKKIWTYTRYDHETKALLKTSNSATIHNREVYPISGLPISISTAREIGRNTIFSFHIPFVGISIDVTEPILQPISVVETNYINRVHTLQNGTEIAAPYASEAIDKQYEIDGSPITVTKTTIDNIDDYGNILSQTISVGEGADDPDAYTTTTVSSYDQENPYYWILGRVTSTTVTASVVDPLTHARHDETRKTNFTYFAGYDPYTPGMLRTTEEEPNDPNLHLTTTYGYDQWGNKNSVQVSGDGSAVYPIANRESTTIYNYFGSTADLLQYRVISTDALGFSETSIVDSRWGTPVSLTGPNGLTTTWKYDAFGRKIEEKRSDNTRTTWSYDPCQPGDNCPNYGAYKITTRQYDAINRTLSAPSVVYYSAAAQELRKETLGLNNDTILQDTQYDELGRVRRTSRPYFSNVNPSYWTTYTYDVYDRPIRVDNPDGSIVTTEYNGLETTINRERRGDNGYTAVTAKQIKNLQGKIAETIDAIGSGGGTATGSRTLYTYHPFGELETVTPQNNGGAITSISYDKRGRKVSMDDPDMGHWEYVHDALGNLRWQKDAKGQVTIMEYDQLNRMVRRIDQKNTPTFATDDDIASWSYYSGTATVGSRGKLASVTMATNNGANTVYSETYTYDALGRPLETQTSYDNIVEPYTVTNTYDANSSRIVSVLYPKSDGNNRYKTVNAYDDNGYLASVSGGVGSNLTKVWEPILANAAGNITWEKLGNGVTTLRGFDPAKGTISSISTGRNSYDNSIQNLQYGFDSLGNLEWRRDNNQKDPLSSSVGVTEAYTYDALNRLTTVSRNGLTTQAYRYDSLGNLTFNSRYGTYSYGENGSGLHAVTTVKRIASSSVIPGDANADTTINSLDTFMVANQIIGNSSTVSGGNPDCNENGNQPELRDTACIARKYQTGARETFEYDANGNMISKMAGSTVVRSLSYTSFNKPQTISNGSTTLSFAYGPDRSRYMQTIQKGTQTEKLHYIGKLFERLEKTDGSYVYKNYVYAGRRMVAIDTRYSDTSKSDQLNYIHRDHLGSIDVITNSAGAIVERSSYTAYGEQVEGVQWNDGLLSQLNFNTTRRGYTEHELLADVGIIHMNGRVYDPELGRFLSADTHIQFPHDAQSYNRYSYVMNNPLSATDPSGYFLARLMASARKFMDRYHRVVIAVGITALVPPSAGIWGAMGGGFASGYIMSGGDVRTAVISALAAGAFYQVGGGAYGVDKTLAHGMVGGFYSYAQGGSFRSGFVSAAFTQGVSWANDSYSLGLYVKPVGLGRIQNAFSAAIIGGSTSRLSGGKFANGAVTGAFSRMFNDEFHSNSIKETQQERMLRENGDVAGYYMARAARGDRYAETALDVVLHDGCIGSQANVRLEAFSRVYGVSYDEYDVNVKLMEAHASYVAADDIGVRGLLSSREIANYHHEVFNGMGLPTTTFGGTPMTGNLNDTYITDWAWCHGCDSASSL
jgi:RHS repeat-associated protein